MSVESRTYGVLSGAAAVTALVPTAIYPEHRMQADVLPAIVYSRVSGFRVNSLSTGYSGLENVEMDISVYTANIDSRREIGDVVITAMTAATIFKCILQESPFDDYDDEIKTYSREISFSVWNRE